LKFLRGNLLNKKKNAGEWILVGRDVVLSSRGLAKILKYLDVKDVDLLDSQVPPLKSGERRESVQGQGCEGEREHVIKASEPSGSSAPPAQSFRQHNGTVELIVTRGCLNPRILVATLPGAGKAQDQQVRVKVKSNVNFRPKMKLRARPIDAEFYELVGRCPRYPGRW